jgi:hypothetical protein
MGEESVGEGEVTDLGLGGGRRDEAQGDVSGYVSRDEGGGATGKREVTAKGAPVGGRP